jgi:hypothetical protein
VKARPGFWSRSERLPVEVVVEVLERYVAGEGGTTIAA